MPTYQYECEACDHSFEVFQSMLDKKIRKCPKCGKLKVYRLIGTGGGVIFKGTGFYETDFKTKKEPSKAAAEPAKSTESTKEAGSAKAETS